MSVTQDTVSAPMLIS